MNRDYFWLGVFAAIATAIVIAAIVSLPGCGLARATNVMATSIPGPAGYTCFAVYNDGIAIGGNCVKD